MIHVHWPITSYIAFIYKLLTGTPFGHTFHISGITKTPLFKLGDYAIAISDELEKEIITNFSYPIFRSFKELPGGGLEMFFPEYYFSRSQDLPEAYHDAGQFYWAGSKVWNSAPIGFSDKTGIVKLPNYRVKDIDTLDDWIEAEFIYHLVRGVYGDLEGS